jgi:hypothetical protein
VLHGDLKADFVFDRISSVSLDTSEHDRSFLGSKKSWQTQSILDSCLFGEIHDYRKRNEANNGADDTFLCNLSSEERICLRGGRGRLTYYDENPAPAVEAIIASHLLDTVG